MNDDNHSDVSCYLHDRLEEIAILKNQCTITYLNTKDEFVKVNGLIIDIYTVDGMDWCRLNNGTIIRLDRIEEFESR